MTIRQLPLRVLYTVNSSPQYILARSPSSVQVTLCPSPSVAHAQYALAPLKACLNAICNSSPELLLDNSRDFSIYILDPLESQTMPAPVDFSQSNVAPVSTLPVVQPRGVAVALGLMSWALTADESDSVPVTGTITALGTGLDALELVFALRETKHVQKSYLSDALKSWGQPSKAAQPTNIPPPRSTHSEVPPLSQEPGRPLTKSADFPEVYIGPPKRARGRPEAANKKPKQSKARKPPVRPGAPPFICAPLVRSQYQQQNPQAAPVSTPSPLITLLSALSGGRDNTALLAALSTVDSAPSGSEPSPMLLNALKDLLATHSHTQGPTHALQPVSRNNQDDEIVILEKEHVDPSAFRRRMEKDDSSKSATTTADESETTPQRQRRVRIPSGGKENTRSSPLNRKRRLSDFMAEQENNEARRKRTHSRSEPRRTSDTFEVPQSAIPLDYLRTARSDCGLSLPVSTSSSSLLSRTKSSPPRPMFRSASESQASFAMPPPDVRVPVKAVKHFVMPEWARTSTVTQPRLSKETEERLALAEHEKKQKRATRRTQKTGCQQQGVGARTEPSSDERKFSGSLVHEKEKTMPRPQSALSLSLPVFASDVSISSPPSSPVSEKPPVPSTPPRRTSVLRATPRSVAPDGASPLFSPTPKSLWRSTEKTPLFSPYPPTPSRKGKAPLFSPVHLRTLSTKISPLQLRLKPRSSLEWTSKSAEQPVDREEEDLLGQELDEALQGLEVPVVKQHTDDSETGDESTMAPLSPLPPSSPLPPTSPLLLPSTDDAMDEFFDSDAFFSDSDAVLGDGSELPPSMISDWLSSDDDGGADVGGFPSVDVSPGVDLEGAFASNVFADMDFAEFWESLKPLLQTNREGETIVTTEPGDSVVVVDVDHGKLAQEVQVLFGGCLM
ncbi:hypothetical protein K503DRAFT_767884 [Rhizopogon vinicolor AM-OR11-026]|uniref:Ams2/SPT21 N-terminal domain-containing protein n=1 Tax=Rhizopogon vinicolor AM-OR11-026 TaxID=1314800 RepID=A0A1B7N8K2_9AGAM|nr:hypothetical protein K503DRAFT_767884 [Rhizopogon vinicolor AM-OR11-026]